MSRRSVAWSKRDPFGAEYVEVELGADRIAAHGTAIGSAPLAYRLDYELETTSGFVTTRLVVTARGDGWTRTLDLRRGSSGAWEERWNEMGASRAFGPRPTADLGALAGALDVDLGLSPLFNTPPVLRHGLLRAAGSVDYVMAWVSVPDLVVHRSPQRYTFIRSIDRERAIVRFESLGEDAFTADLTYDNEGLVLDYPGIGTRLS
jgi:hypothetical protein